MTGRRVRERLEVRCQDCLWSLRPALRRAGESYTNVERFQEQSVVLSTRHVETTGHHVISRLSNYKPDGTEVTEFVQRPGQPLEMRYVDQGPAVSP